MFLGVWLGFYLLVQKEVGCAVSLPVIVGQDVEDTGELMGRDLWSYWSSLPFRARQLSA